jgi:phosphomannomutase
VAGQPVVSTDALDTNDGFKFWLEDGSWMLVRFSGTEPLVRIYAEGTTPEVRDAILREGGVLVGGGH